MSDEVRAFRRCEELHRDRDEFNHLLKVARAGSAEKGFELREGLLDGIEIRTVGRQKPQLRAGRLDQALHLWLFVGRQIIEDDDLTGPQHRDEHLLRVGEERGIVDGPVEDSGRRQAIDLQAGDQRMRLPMAARREITKTRAAGTPAIASEQIRRDAALIEKDERSGVAERLPLSPTAARHDDVRAALFGGVYGFF